MSASEPLLGNTTEFASASAFTEKYGRTALRFYLLSIARDLLPQERIAVCWRYLLPERETVEIIYSEERKRARSRGTMKCGNGWICPACSLFIAERRRQELMQAVETSRDSFFPVMITYTAQHSKATNLQDLLPAMNEAYRSFRSGRWWQDVKTEWFIAGSVRATEITYGESGWHPHYHELSFARVADLIRLLKGDVSFYASTLENQLQPQWVESLKKHGLTASLKIGLTVTGTDSDVADYVTKFGKMPIMRSNDTIGHEIASGLHKRARGGNLSVWDILFSAGNGDKQSKKLFLEYHAATKGKSQLQWSRNLKAVLNIDEIRDEIAAEGIETDSDRLLAELSREQWKLLTTQGRVPQLMEIANTGDGEKMSWFLSKVFDGIVFEHFDFSQF